MERDRIGPRVMAWAEADRQDIFIRLLGLEMALRATVELLETTAYALHKRQELIAWRALLETVPPS